MANIDWRMANEFEQDKVELEEKKEDELDDLEDVQPLEKKSAGKLSSKEIAKELGVRGISSTGFWGDDARVLQSVYDKEHDAAVQKLEKLKEEALERQKKARELAEKREKQLREQMEEQTGLKANPQLAFWIGLVQSNQCLADCSKTDLTPPLCRVLSRVLGSNTSLTSLDLSHSIIGEASGGLLFSALSKNRSIKRLELENTGLGVNAACKVEELLENNNTLVHLNLEDNDLTDQGSELIGVESVANGVKNNKTLTQLNLWRTNLGSKGGTIIAQALACNSSIVSLQIGCNQVGVVQERSINESLQRNKEIRARVLHQQHERLLEERAMEHARLAREEEHRKQTEEEEWLQARKVERAQERKRRAEEEMRQMEEERKRQEVERQRLDEERRKAEEAKRKKKKGKKKKQKKK